MPLMKCRFVGRFSGAIKKEVSEAITCQITKINTDFLNKTVTVEVRQPVFMSALTEGIESLIDSHIKPGLTIYYMNGGENSVANMEFSNLECTKHSFNVDYSDSLPATHILEFKYGSLNANHEVVKL